MDRVEVLVIGAGVVGLAIARALAEAGREVWVIEQAPQFGSGVSSRSSEVIHAGLYDAPGSLKASLCVRGRALLYDYCRLRGVGHRRCGKLVVATEPDGEARLLAIADRAAVNGVDDLRLLGRAQAQALEPALSCNAALLSPSSGIVDSHGLMLALLGDAERAGAMLVLATSFIEARARPARWRVRTRSGGADFELEAGWLINAAGLDAQRVAAAIDGLPPAAIPRQHRAKGHYFALPGRAPFSRLIYPLPVDGGLGVHLTLDLGGQARFGPDVEWLAADAPLDYAVDARRAAGFEAQIRRYWPGLPEKALTPAYSGIRPKLGGPGEPAADFQIAGPAQHGCAGLVNLFGIESPGLTAALALAERAAALLRD